MKKRERTRKVTIGKRDIYAHGLNQGFWADFYHNAMTVSWGMFVAATATCFVVINAFFALLYTLGNEPVSDVPAGDVLRFFYFSIETLATVGYGDMHPQTHYGHVVASVETFFGLFLTALLTGLIFSRFSRPRARFIFAKLLIIAHHDGKLVMTARLANARLNMMSGANAKLWMIRNRTNVEGVRFRGFEELGLQRSENPIFSLSWTLFHTIDDTSPIVGMTRDDLALADASFLLTVTGHDDTAAQSVYARESYALEDVRWHHRFKDIISNDEDGRTWIDYRLIHDVEPLSDQPASASSPS